MKWIERNMLSLVACSYVLLFFLGIGAFILNGLFGFKFQLDFIWNGIGALSGAGFFSAVKYVTDSCKNSEQGVTPYVQSIARTASDVLERK